MQIVYARGGGGSQQREVANGADMVFTDTVSSPYQLNKQVEQAGEVISIKWCKLYLDDPQGWNANCGGQDSN